MDPEQNDRSVDSEQVPEPPQAFTVRQVATMLQCSPQTVKRLIFDEELPAFKLGSRWRIARETLYMLFPHTEREFIKLNTPKDKKKSLARDKREAADAIAIYWNDHRPKEVPVVHVPLTETRAKRVLTRIGEPGFAKSWPKVLECLNKNEWARGHNHNGWVATFDWMIRNDTNWQKIIERVEGVKK